MISKQRNHVTTSHKKPNKNIIFSIFIQNNNNRKHTATSNTYCCLLWSYSLNMCVKCNLISIPPRNDLSPPPLPDIYIYLSIQSLCAYISTYMPKFRLLLFFLLFLLRYIIYKNIQYSSCNH